MTHQMRIRIFVIFSALILLILNWGIYEKEQIKQTGRTVYLELAPADPRSIMQGDYMRLNYQITNSAPINKLETHQKRGYLIANLDEKNVARFARFDDGTPLAENEISLHFHKQYGRLRIVPDSFLFQEGHAKFYDNADYGIFKFADNRSHILVGLADDKFKRLGPGLHQAKIDTPAKQEEQRHIK